MPQMAPINWLLLFIIFCLTYLFFNILNYYIFSPTLKSSDKKLFNKITLNWKW
uniref:ATP synthase F0 subunit 8 n=1 Tax=Forcipomyia pulchrithorax TaxID=3042879 RepID=UPI002A83AEE9|nr:ATP synthase F0 subunit 8 [Forcipomyia pulchrithorax]WOR86777.1 ATP synthase F0 subunit 8 [Forcipomyia pulchrithorax]